MARRPTEAGVLLVDKPPELTSHDVVTRVRSALATRRVGHAGTLDPFATGLLLLCIDRATRLVEYIHRYPKTYRATLRLGIETDTHDPTGRTVDRSERWREITRPVLGGAMEALRARRLQTPPAFSAKRRGGRRAYEAARRGRTLELEPVPVEVHRLELLAFRPPYVEFETSVSTGTYVRGLARDLGRDLGCGAHLTRLRRTRVGPFLVDDAVDLAEIEACQLGPPAWVAPVDAVAWLPRRELDEREVERVRHGQAVSAVPSPEREPAVEWVADPAETRAVALVSGSRLVGIAELRDGRLMPRKVLLSG